MKGMLSSLFAVVLFTTITLAQQESGAVDKLIVVTFDGLRWQELFMGADSVLLRDDRYTEDRKTMEAKFWDPLPEARRKKLLPFIWSTIQNQGRIYGNRFYGNDVSVLNPHWFSYPGYHEMLTGYPDSSIDSNDKIPNPHTTVLEYLNKMPRFRGKVAAFTSWDVFPFILNEARSGIYVNSAYEKVKDTARVFRLLDDMQMQTYRQLGDGVRPDLLTYHTGKAYLQQFRPSVLYFGFDETDDFAHGGKYDLYPQAAHMTDKLIADLWNFLQQDAEYRGRTVLLLTTDHGRGDKVKEQWRDHGKEIVGAEQIWLAAIGPGISAGGEMKDRMQISQAQIAATLAMLLGEKYAAGHPIAPPIHDLYRKSSKR